MELAKVSCNGQITVPVEIRRILGLKPGQKILFDQNRNGEITMKNASVMAITRGQVAFLGAAEAFGVANEDDVQSMVNEERYGSR